MNINYEVVSSLGDLTLDRYTSRSNSHATGGVGVGHLLVWERAHIL